MKEPVKKPWMKFYPGDWRSDPRLRMCSLAARGLWVEMLALMHEAKPYGYLLVGGKPPSDSQLAILVGAPPEAVPGLLSELGLAGVFSRDRRGVLFSRRMVRDEIKSRSFRKNGLLGGNPSLRKERDNTVGVNPHDKAQRLEARDQRLEREEESPIPPSKSGSDLVPAEPVKTETHPARKRALEVPPEVLAEFDRIWPHYPRRVAVARARKAWVKARRIAPFEEIAGPLRACIAVWKRGTPVDKIPHFASWLNAEGWKDEPTHAANRPRYTTDDLEHLSKLDSPEDLEALMNPTLRIAK